MSAALILFGSMSLGIWVYLGLARGNFWRLSEFDDDGTAHEAPQTWPSVAAIVPARNEASAIRRSVTSLQQQNYPGEFSVVVVDDHSEDGTAEVARQTAREAAAESRIRILTAPPLPPGWTGKLWALTAGVNEATAITGRGEELSGAGPGEPLDHNAVTYYWFSDADISHAPETLQRLVSRAEGQRLDLTSLMVLLQAKSFPERALIPAFLFFFLKLYPPSWISNPAKRIAGAAGGCILLRREALDRIGGLAAIRSEVIDDCALARAIKHAGGKIWMGLTRASISLRAYCSMVEIRDLIARTAFTQLRHSIALLGATVLAMLLTYVAPVVLLFASHPGPRVLGGVTWLLMSFLYLGTIRFYRLNPIWAAVLPLTALFYSYATVLSAIRYYLGRGAQWKGRSQG